MPPPAIRNAHTRPATGNDLAFLEDVFIRAGREMLTAARGEWNEERERHQFRRQLDVRATQIVRLEGREVGFVMVVVGENVSEIHTLCIDPTSQGMGLGTKITHDVVNEARTAGRSVELSVLKANPRARALYERLGFEVVSDTDHHHRMRFVSSPTARRDAG